MSEKRLGREDCYALLQVDPSAPLELITAIYWHLRVRAQVSKGNGGSGGPRLRRLNHAYDILSDPVKRAAYDRSLHGGPATRGANVASVDSSAAAATAAPKDGRPGIDYYQLLRVSPQADREIIGKAYRVMRGEYETAVAEGRATPELLELVDEAYGAIGTVAGRRLYDADRAPLPQLVQVETVAAGSTASPLAERLARIDRDSALFYGSLALSGVSALFIILGMALADLKLTDYGIADSYPFTFHIGLFLLPIGSAGLWFSNRKVDGIVLAQLMLLLVAIWLSPYLLEETARFRSSYKNFSAVDWIASGNGFEPDVVVYHNWPFFPVVMTFVIKLTGISPTQLMGLFPFLIQVAYLFPLTYLLRVFRPSGNGWWAGIWFFYLFNWTGQDYFAPQALAFFFFLCLLAMLAHAAARRQGHFTAGAMGLLLAVYGCLVLTHVLTAGIVLAMIAALTLSGQVKQRSIVLAAGVMFAAWQIYGASPFFNLSQDRIEDNILDLQDFFNLNVGSRLAGAPDHVVVGRLRMLMTLVAAGLAGICFLMRITETHDRRNLFLMERGETTMEAFRSLSRRSLMYLWQPAPFAVFCFVGLVAVAPLYVYGGEMLIRSLLFSLPAFALLVAGAFSWRTPMIAVVGMMAFVAPLHMIARYGNEMYDYVSPQEVQGFNYVGKSLEGPANIYGAYPAAAYINIQDLDWRYGIKPGKSKPPEADGYLRPDQHRWAHPEWPIYVAISRGDDAAARLFYNEPDFIESVKEEIERLCNFEPVYENPDFSLYKWSRSCEPSVSQKEQTR